MLDVWRAMASGSFAHLLSGRIRAATLVLSITHLGCIDVVLNIDLYKVYSTQDETDESSF